MAPSRGIFDVEAISGICGSVSIACWVVVFSPQILENFRRSSVEGLSLNFLIIWLLGDVFNILGAILQGVVPTMIVLAVWYMIADVILLAQCFYYSWRRTSEIKHAQTVETNPRPESIGSSSRASERDPLLPHRNRQKRSKTSHNSKESQRKLINGRNTDRAVSRQSSDRAIDPSHLSPATPFIAGPSTTTNAPATRTLNPRLAPSAFIFNTLAVVAVCGIGILGWYLSQQSSKIPYPRGPHHHRPRHRQRPHKPHGHGSFDSEVLVAPGLLSSKPSEDIHFDVWGQVFGYLCAILYLGSRIPQLLLNFKRKSTEGLNILFFIFACLGNATFVLSILAFEPSCDVDIEPDPSRTGSRMLLGQYACSNKRWIAEYNRYVLVNLSWLIGSLGTLILDMLIFGQFWSYKSNAPNLPPRSTNQNNVEV